MQNLIVTLRQLFQEVAVAPNSKVRTATIVSRVKSAMEAAVCSLYLMDDEGILTLVATEGLNQGSIGKIKLRPGEGLVGRIAETYHPLNLKSASEDPHFLYFPESGEENFEAFLGAPVVRAGKLVGVLVVERKERGKFTEEEESFLVTVAAHLGATHLDDFHFDLNDDISENSCVKGVAGAPGIGIGRVLLLPDATDLMTVQDTCIEDVEVELARFRNAVKETLDDLSESQRKLASSVSGEVAEIFSVYQLLLQGDELSGAIEKVITSGKSATSALRAVVLEFMDRFAMMDDEYLRTRGEDIQNLGNRVFARLGNRAAPKVESGEQVVLVGRLVSIADIAEYPPDQIAGIVSMEGSVLSHTAILGKALGLPTVMGIGQGGNNSDGKIMIVNGYQGEVFIDPGTPVIDEFQRLIAKDSSLAVELEKLKESPAETIDGFLVRLYANTGLLADITPGLTHGAEGIGLYRTEIPFIVHGSFPSEDEQVAVYSSVLRAYQGMPVYMRTLDVGGDKPLPYFPFEEENPALGWRGVRFTLDNSVIFMTQIRAMLRAARGDDSLRIILPMISSVSEVDSFLALLDSALEQLVAEKFDVRRPKVGIMVEVPASIAILPFLGEKIDFVSIGSNDLTQYLLAVDRGNPEVTDLFDHLHPAVLQAVEEIGKRSASLGVPVSVCGEMAADPCASLLLLGLGINSLSMPAFSVPRIKWLIRSVSSSEAREQLALAMECHGPAEIRSQVHDFLASKGLGRLFEHD